MNIQQEREQLVADVTGNDDERMVEAATQLLAMGEKGDPAGSYLLAGGKAALRLRRNADAAVLLSHAVRVAERRTPLWVEMLVNRSIACTRLGGYIEAIEMGNQFLANQDLVPQDKLSQWIGKVHHSLGRCYDRMGDQPSAARHFELAAESYTGPSDKAIAHCDLACAMAMCGNAGAAEEVLNRVDWSALTQFGQFVWYSTYTVVLYHQGRFTDAQKAGDIAESLARGQEDAWTGQLLDLRLWRSRIAWNAGDRLQAGTLALHVAMRAVGTFNVALGEKANEWLITMTNQGGMEGA